MHLQFSASIRVYKNCLNLGNLPLVVPFSRPSVALLSLYYRFSARSRGYVRANVTFPVTLLGGGFSRNGLKQRRDSVSYPSIHPRQIRDKCNEVFYAGQDEDKMWNKRSTTHAACLYCSLALASLWWNAKEMRHNVLMFTKSECFGHQRQTCGRGSKGQLASNTRDRTAATNGVSGVNKRTVRQWLAVSELLSYQFVVA